MLQQSETPAKASLSPDDLELLERFLLAWCEENGVDRTDAAALEIASSLIDWFRLDQKARSRIQIEQQDDLAASPQIEHLLRQIT